MKDIKKLEGEVFVGAKTFDTDYSDRYLISNMGRCWNIKKNKFVGHCNNGYITVHIRKNGKTSTIMIGRLMLMSFNVSIPVHLKGLDKRWLQASHINEDRADNRLENLMWESPKENCNRPLHKGKLCKPIIQYTKDNIFIREWGSTADAGRVLGIKRSNITNCCKGRYHSAGGFIWRYKNEET